MATSAYQTEEVTLEDGTVVTLRPNNIKHLRLSLDRWESLAEDGAIPTTTDVLNAYIYICGVSLTRDLKQKFSGNVFVEGSKTDLIDDYIEYLEENLTQPVIEKVMSRCAGINVSGTDGDPKDLEVAADRILDSAEGGEN